MAVYGLTAKFVQRSKGQSAVAAAAYRSGQSLTDERTGIDHDYHRRRGVSDSFILTPVDAPDWAADRAQLWNRVEARENHAKAQPAREFLLTLPAELSLEEQKSLVVDWVSEHLTSRGIVADVAIHNSAENNPHAHVLSTTRMLGERAAIEQGFEIDSDGWAKNKIREYKNELQNTYRPSWARAVNDHLELAGVEARVDHRAKIEQYRDAYRRDPFNIPSHLTEPPEAKKGKDIERLIAKGEDHGLVRGYNARRIEAQEKWDEQTAAARGQVREEIREHYLERIIEAGQSNDQPALEAIVEELQVRKQKVHVWSFEQAVASGASGGEIDYKRHQIEREFDFWSELYSDASDLKFELSIEHGFDTASLEAMLSTQPELSAPAAQQQAAAPERDHLGRTAEQIERDRQRLIGRDGPSLGR